jgi:hypothetical protein
VLPYLAIGWQGDSTLFIVTLFYVTALAVINGLLYRMSDSVLPGVVSSILFHLLTSLQ